MSDGLLSAAMLQIALTDSIAHHSHENGSGAPAPLLYGSAIVHDFQDVLYDTVP